MSGPRRRNGATDVVSWEILTGSHPNVLVPAAHVLKDGFETEVAVPQAQYVRALGYNGASLLSGVCVGGMLIRVSVQRGASCWARATSTARTAPSLRRMGSSASDRRSRYEKDNSWHWRDATPLVNSILVRSNSHRSVAGFVVM